MTTDQQRLALLEWAGWKDICVCTCGIKHRGRLNDGDSRHLPDLDSLNTIAEFEGKLSGEQKLKKWEVLYEMLGRGSSVRQFVYLRIMDATAPQRIEALVRALGLWKQTL